MTLTVAAWICWHCGVFLAIYLRLRDHNSTRFYMLRLAPIILFGLAFALFAIRYYNHRLKFPTPPEQDVRLLLRGQRLSGVNLFPCADCAGYRGAHAAWCGRPRPRDFVDDRMVSDHKKRHGFVKLDIGRRRNLGG